MKLGNPEEAIYMLCDGVEFIKAQAESFNIKKNLDILLLRDCSFGYGHDGSAVYSNPMERIRSFVCSDDFKPLAEYSRYKSLAIEVTTK